MSSLVTPIITPLPPLSTLARMTPPTDFPPPSAPSQKRPRSFWDTVLAPQAAPASPASPASPSSFQQLNLGSRPQLPAFPGSSLPDFPQAVSSPVSQFTDNSQLGIRSPERVDTDLGVQRVIHKPTSPQRPHVCGSCGSSFARGSHLRLHIRTIHEKLKPFQCEQCPAAFGHVSSKYRHFRTVHLKRRDFACDRCGQTFAERAAVLKHCRTVHEGSRPYPCPTCGFRFHFKLHLSQHISTVHEKQRPHQCPICNVCFGQRSSLNRHSRQLHGVSTKK